MTIQRTFFNWSFSGLNHNRAPYEDCAANLKQLLAFILKTWGGASLGCHSDRTIVGGSALSAHSYGAALDWRYTAGSRWVSRTTVLTVLIPWLINNSKELGIDAIHDYVGDRIWRAGRTSNVAEAHTAWWKKQNGAGGQMGESWAQWLHIETTQAAHTDNRPVTSRPGIKLPSGVTPTPPQDTTYHPSETDLKAPPGTPTLKIGVNAPTNVRWLQELMKDVGWHMGSVDGVFGSQTAESVKRMQGTLATTRDGVYGPITAGKLAAWLGTATPRPPETDDTDSKWGPNEPQTAAAWMAYGASQPTTGLPSGTSFRRGTNHANVTHLQAVLSSIRNLPADGSKPIYNPEWIAYDRIGSGGPVRGLYGDATHNAVRYWQSHNGLLADGVYGPKTMERLKQVRGK